MKFFVTTLAVCAMAFANAQDSCCKAEAKQGSCEVVAKVDKDAEFMAEAHRMMAAAEGKKMCCKSTASMPKMKGEDGCCNAKGEMAKFKVFVSGVGYQFFGCEGSAKKGRTEWVAKGHKAGNVQKVASKVAIH